MIKVIVFDFDGVIVESVDIKTEAFGRLFEKEKPEAIKAIVEYHLANTGVSRFDKFRYVYRELLKRPLGDGEFQSLCDRFSTLVVDDVVKAAYVPGALEFLEKYSAGYNCYVASATPREELERIIEKRNLRRFFKGIFGAPVKKSDVLAHVISQEGVASGQVIYVGDAASDYDAARANSVRFIARLADTRTSFVPPDCPKLADLSMLQAIVEQM